MMSERSPRKSSHWVQLGFDPRTQAVVYKRGALRVLSALSDMQLPGQPDGTTGPTFHVSVSQRGGSLVSDADLKRVRRDFGMLEAEEDNHHPGRARHLMLPADPRHRVACECKTDEETIVTDGYAWTNPKDATPETCRGCEYEGMHGNPCPVHRAVSASP